ncbi:MAG: hypothetical protein LBL49_00705 [Clostridiales Family XIII bacterium]|jgi:hypothetical protein|nr:hypothetical protein [Clostridiales Family XIII bacterium]
MKRKSIVFLLVTVLLVAGVYLTTSAAENATFNVLLDRAGQTVTVTGSGYDANEKVSLIAAYNAPPAYDNLDYIDQLTADGDGNIAITFPSAQDEWLGGHSYYVALNGEVNSEMILATYAKVHTASRISVKMRTPFQLSYDVDGVAFEFTSSNNSILKVDENGLITPVRAGSATVSIHTTDGSDLRSSALVNVVP